MNNDLTHDTDMLTGRMTPPTLDAAALRAAAGRRGTGQGESDEMSDEAGQVTLDLLDRLEQCQKAYSAVVTQVDAAYKLGHAAGAAAERARVVAVIEKLKDDLGGQNSLSANIRTDTLDDVLMLVAP